MGAGARRGIAFVACCGAAFAIPLAGCDGDDASQPARDGGGSLTAVSAPARSEPVTGADPALWTTPLADPELEAGRRVWTGTCIACHASGLGGAPLIGSEPSWRPRLAQGLEVLVAHATEGFYGDVGEMPARGGNASLSDAEVRAAVRFMATRAGPLP